MQLNEVLPDARLNQTQLKVKYLDPDKNQCYLRKGDYENYYLVHLQDPVLDKAMVKLSQFGNEIRPTVSVDNVADQGIETEHEAYISHFLQGLPEQFRRLGFGRKCYYMLMEQLDCVLLSGTNRMHIATPQAIRAHQSMNNYEKTASLYQEVEGNSYIVTFRKGHEQEANEVMDAYIKTGTQASENIDDEIDIESLGSWLDDPQDDCFYSYTTMMPYLCVSLQLEENNMWSKDAAFITDIEHKYKYDQYDFIKLLAKTKKPISQKYNNHDFMDAYNILTNNNAINDALKHKLNQPLTIEEFYNTFKQIKNQGFKILTAEEYMKKENDKFTNIGILLRPSNYKFYELAEKCN